MAKSHNDKVDPNQGIRVRRENHYCGEKPRYHVLRYQDDHRYLQKAREEQDMKTRSEPITDFTESCVDHLI